MHSGDPIITNLHSDGNGQSGELTFYWDPVKVTGCSLINYMITATDGCGTCPQLASETVAKCTNVVGGMNCTFSILADACGVQIRSEPKTLITGTSGKHAEPS